MDPRQAGGLNPVDRTATLARYYLDGPMYVDEHILLHEGGNGAGQGRDYVYLLGPLYSVTGLADPYGNVVQAYPYDAFGTIAVTAPPAPTVEAAGCRYLKVVLPNITEAVAMRVQKLVNGVASGEGWYAGPTFDPLRIQGLRRMGDTGLEPVTSCVSSRRSSQLS